MNQIKIILIALLISCSSVDVLTTVKFKPFKNSSSFFIKIPKSYKALMFAAGNEWYGEQYWYPDSSVIYISTGPSMDELNWSNLKNSGLHDKYLARFSNYDDTIVFQGVQNDGLYWKAIHMGRIVSIGYANVPQKKKELFDEALKSFNGGRR